MTESIVHWEADAWLSYHFDQSAELKIAHEELLAIAYLKHLRDHVVKNKFSFMASFDGRHRSAKSVTACTIGCLWDSTFEQQFEHRIVQDHLEFMDAIDSLDRNGIKGGVIMVDEAGISMASTDWYEQFMKTITKTMQMFGYLLPVVLFVAPTKDFVDSRIRKMFHAYYKMERYNNDYTTITPYNVKYNTIFNKWFYKKPVLRLNGQEIILKRIKFGLPPPFITERYQALEITRKAKMKDGFMRDIRQAQVADQKKEVDIDKMVNFVIERYGLYESKSSSPDDIRLDEIKLEFGLKSAGVTSRSAKYIKMESERIIKERMKAKKEQMEIKKEVI